MIRKMRRICAVTAVIACIVSFVGASALAGDPYEIIQVVDGSFVGSVQSNAVVIESVDAGAPADTGAATHVVTFLDWYGRELSRVEVADGQSIAAPENPPQVDGQAFQFWFDEMSLQSTPYQFGTPVTQSLRLIPYYSARAEQTVTLEQPQTPADTSGATGTGTTTGENGMPEMPKMPVQYTAPTEQAATADAAKKQASYFIDQMVKAIEPSETTINQGDVSRIANEITQIAPQQQADPAELVEEINNNILQTPVIEPAVTENPVQETDPLELINVLLGDLAGEPQTAEPPTTEPEQLGIDPNDIIQTPPATEEPTQPEPPATEEPVITDAPTLIEDLLATEQPAMPEAPAEETQTPIITETPDAEETAQPDRPPTLEELLAIGQQPTQAPASAMSDQQAMDIVNDILSQMQMEATIEEDTVGEIIDLLEEDRADEATDMIEEIFQTQMPTQAPADPTATPWETGGQKAEPYVVATYHYEGELVAGTIVTVTANVYNLPDGQRLSFQWQNNRSGVFEDVPGATSQSHTFIADEQGLNGSSWRVNVLLED